MLSNPKIHLSIIIPAFNEEKTVGKLISKVNKVKLSKPFEIIVVDDGSKDKTPKILSKIKGIKLITNKTNLGKGASILKALKMAQGEIILIQDADLEYDPKYIPSLIAPFKNRNVKVVYGSRNLAGSEFSSLIFGYGGVLLTLITNLLYKSKISDEATGFKVFRKKVLKQMKLTSKGFEFCPEVTAKILKKGIKIREIPVIYHPRPMKEKKIKWPDGIKAIYYLFKYRFLD